jgi:hypothetical protein
MRRSGSNFGRSPLTSAAEAGYLQELSERSFSFSAAQQGGVVRWL